MISELAFDGSMTTNTMSWTTEDYIKDALLHKLQKSVHFVKTIRPSHMPNFDNSVCAVALPAWFVKKHGERFRRTVFLRSGLSTKPWPVQLSICSRQHKSPEVKFTKGWRSFAASNGIIEGDDLLFSLRAMSEFDVYVFRETGNNPRDSSSFQAPRKRDSREFEVSQTVQSQSGRCKDHAGRSESQILCTKKQRVGEVGAILAFHGRCKPGRFASSNFDLHYLESRNLRDPSSLRCDSHQGQKPPVRVHGDGDAHRIGARKGNANKFEDTAAEETRKSPPSFVKRLTANNFCGNKNAAHLEIPKSFVRTYGSELHRPIVKLQGVHERCPTRIVVCKWKSFGKQTSRLCLTDGWREFGDENCLELGQELMFTLTGDSFLVVRVIS